MTNLLDIYKMHQLEFCKNDKASGQELDIFTLLLCRNKITIRINSKEEVLVGQNVKLRPAKYNHDNY